LPARGGFGGDTLFQQAGRAKPGQRAGRQRRAALRTFVSVGHGLVQFYRVHTRFRSKTGRMLREFIENHEIHKPHEKFRG
jgi:hypothetical protein